MYAPLSEHVENQLGIAFCLEYRVYGTYERPLEWEDYKDAFAKYLIEKFIGKKLPPEPQDDWRPL